MDETALIQEGKIDYWGEVGEGAGKGKLSGSSVRLNE